jgi:hypothetical protein
MIWVVHPGSRIRMLTFYPSRIRIRNTVFIASHIPKPNAFCMKEGNQFALDLFTFDVYISRNSSYITGTFVNIAHTETYTVKSLTWFDCSRRGW